MYREPKYWYEYLKQADMSEDRYLSMASLILSWPYIVVPHEYADLYAHYLVNWIMPGPNGDFIKY